MRVRTRNEFTKTSPRAFDRYASELINRSSLQQLQRSIAREPMAITGLARRWNGRVVVVLADGTQLLMRGGWRLFRTRPERLVSLDLLDAQGRWTLTARTSTGSRVACSVIDLQRGPVSVGRE
jgi:hypothetical protein